MNAKRNRSQMEIAFQRLEAHMLFICPECGDTYQTQQQWRQHLNYNHDYLCKKPEDFNFTEVNDRYHECKTCNVMVADGKRAIALLQYHRFLHLKFSNTYRCRHCPASFTRKRVLCEHLCRNHEKKIGEKLTASTVEKLSSTIKAITQETSKTTKENSEFYMRYLCPQCGKSIDDYKAWVLHIKTIHADTVRDDCEMQKVPGTKNSYCRICRKVVQGDNAKLQRHYFTHMPYKILFSCAFCKVRRAYKTELLHHFIRTHIKEFETHKKLIRKPIEWGADANEKLEKELDLLLKHGNGFGSKGPSSMHFTSTTILNSFSQTTIQTAKTGTIVSRNQENNKNTNRKLFNNSFDSDDNSIRSNIGCKEISKRHRNGMIRSKSMGNLHAITKATTKNKLEDLCAEIFDDIDMETTLVSDNIKKSTNDANNQVVEGSNNLNLNGNNREEIIKIEINALDENELNQLEAIDHEMDSLPDLKRQKLNDSIESYIPVEQSYKTLKSLFNAKILHLCPKCGKQFDEQSSWREHVLYAHENLSKIIEDSFKQLDDQNANLCLNCMQVLPTTNKSELQRHCFTHMPYHAYLKCTLCGLSKANKSKMLHHLETEHNSLIKEKTKMNNIEKNDTEASSTKQMEMEEDIKEKHLLPSNLKKSGYQYHHLMTHLLNARDRLNRIAAGIEAL